MTKKDKIMPAPVSQLIATLGIKIPVLWKI